ncbi:MAG: hypothetical protein ACOC7R_04080, partial [Planctomycetota bacterium]
MSRTRATGMWGVDIADKRLRLVRVIREGRRLRLSRAVGIAVATDATEAQVADLLRRAVLGSGEAGDPVAVCLPATGGYVRGDGQEPSAAPHAVGADDFIADTWSVGDGDAARVVHAAVDRAQALRLIGIVRRAGLRAVHVSLAQLAT